MVLKAQKGGGRPFGWHSGTITCKDANILGDLTIQDDIIFGGISAGKLAVTGGIDMQSTTSAIGLDLGGTFTTSAINIDGTLSNRALMIGSKRTAGSSDDASLAITAPAGTAVDTEPANNYLFGLFSKVAATAATSNDELRGAWIRTRVNANCDIGSNANWGYGVCGAEVQLKFYGGASDTDVYSWQASALWAQLETDGATRVHFENGCVAAAVFANVGLTATSSGYTLIDTGAVACGVAINSNTATNVTATGGFYGLYVYHDNTALKDFTAAIYLESAFTTGIEILACTTGLSVSGTTTTAISLTGAVTRAMRVGGANDWGTGSSGLTISATDPLVQVLGKISSTNVTGGMYASSYSQATLTASQNTGVSFAASWNELYLTGAINLTGSGNYYAVWGHIEANAAATTSTGNLAALNGSLIIPTGFTCAGEIAGCKVDAILHTSMSYSGSGRSSAFAIGAHTDPNQGDWNYGFYIPASTVTTGICIDPAGTTNGIQVGHPSASVGHGLRPNMTNPDSAGAPVGFYFDDGGSAVTAWGESFTVGMLYKTASSGGAQTGMPYTAFFYNDVQAAFDGAASCGWSTVMTSFCVTGALSGFEVGVSSLHTSVDVNATSTLAAETTLSCISFGGNWISGLSGKIVPLNVRATNQDWSAFAAFPNADNGCFQLAAASGGTDQYLKILIGGITCTIAVKVGT